MAGVIYFAVRGRHTLVLAPEEEFALTRGEHGHVEREGYGHTHVVEVTVGEIVEGEVPEPLAPEAHPASPDS